MLSNILITAVLALTASAAPHYPGKKEGTGANQPQVPFKFPLANGFPNIQVPSANLTAIQKQALGTLPNGPLPKKISDVSATTLQLIAFNEIFEVAYFTSLLNNITTGDYDIGTGAAKALVLKAITAVQAQEELHALGANAILASAGRTPIKPCEYVFPTTNFDDAVALASTFTDLVLGTLQDALLNFGSSGDEALLPLIGSVIGQEGEQVGYYRSLLFETPSELPFLTRSAAPYAFSALNQLFVVPGSCPNSNIIGLPVFGALSVLTPKIEAKNMQVTFSFKTKAGEDVSCEGLSLVYINQQNVPVVEKLENIKQGNGMVTFTAYFPGGDLEMNAFTIAAVTNKAGPFADADAVAAATLYGPGLIEVKA